MNDREIAELVAYCKVLWPSQRDVDVAEQIVAWGQLLHDVDARAARAAVDLLATDGDRFPPPPGLIRKHALLLSLDADTPTPEQAWQEVLDKIGTVGWWSTVRDRCGPDCVGGACEHHLVRFSHPAVQAAVDGLGWRELCWSEDQMADRAHFIRFYAAAVERLTRAATVPPTVAAIIAARPVPEVGPGEPTGRALPSAVVTGEERDDDAHLAQLAQVQEVLAAARRAATLDD